MNRPYVKQYDLDDELMNPVVGSYMNLFPNRRLRRDRGNRAFSNKKGVQVVITRIGRNAFTKYTKINQNIKGKIITHYKEN